MLRRESGLSGGAYWLVVAFGAATVAYAARWLYVRSDAKLLITEVERHLGCQR